MRVRAFPPGSSRSSTRLSVLSTIIVPVHATELFHDLADLPGSRDAGATDGISASRLINGVEYAHSTAVDERPNAGRLEAAARRWGRATAANR